MNVRRALTCVLLPALLLVLSACGTKGASDYNKGVEAGQSGDYTSAMTHYNAAIAANPEFTEAYYNRGQAQLHLGRKAAQSKQDAEAAKLWKACMVDRKKARELMDRGVWFVVKEGEREALKKSTADALTANDLFEKMNPSDEVIAKVLRDMPEPAK